MTDGPIRTVPLGQRDGRPGREWLVTNGLGGYASGPISGWPTWRYHGVLVSALPAPYGRVIMLNHLSEILRLPDRSTMVTLSGEEGSMCLTDFRLELGLPVWTYEMDGIRIEKRLVMPHLQNTVVLTYRLLSAPSPVRLSLRPWLQFRGIEEPVDTDVELPYRIHTIGERTEILGERGLAPLRIYFEGATARHVLDYGTQSEVFYPQDAERGYPSRGRLWSPGAFRLYLNPHAEASMVASTEPWHALQALPPPDIHTFEASRRRRLIATSHPAVRDGAAAELVLTADSFLIKPTGRIVDSARAHAAGDEVRTVIAGYHWFTDWGRDTMISLEGLTLTTGRLIEAAWILRTFAHHIRDGLIPNMFPEGKTSGLYHTADATLWFFHAIHRYVTVSEDRATLRSLLPRLKEIVAHHVRGTRFGIRIDPEDGLMRQGEEGYQLTWMDAKVGDWVVTPRRGKAVELNALWFNALRLLEGWLRDEQDPDASEAHDMAERAFESFNKRFWNEASGHLYDVVDGAAGDDPACRPNQLFAVSLPHPILDRSHWLAVVDICERKLVTPLGLRSLSPDHPDYKSHYYGNLRARDAAYHQGTVWAWLIGPFIDAWLKVHPGEHAQARRFLEGFPSHLDEAGIGSIAEIFDGEPPFQPRGCIAQAWSVAEVLRCWALTANGREEGGRWSNPSPS